MNRLIIITLLFLTISSNAQTLVDADGNSYNTVKIGNQIWLKENLKTTKFNDGTPIPLITDSANWVSSKAPAYCWYNNDEEKYKPIYGALYNWYVVDSLSNGDKNVCPVGSHVPSNTEWDILIIYAGGVEYAGINLKETGTSHWEIPNQGATDNYNFTALPGGTNYKGEFSDIGRYGIWWSSTISSIVNQSYYRVMSYRDTKAY